MSDNAPNRLPVPPAAEADAASREMVRVWIAGKGLHASLNIGAWDQNEGVDEVLAWGVVLADLVRHVANALEERNGIDRAETILRIRKMMEVELGSPTDEPRGQFTE